MYAPPLPKEEMHEASKRSGDDWAEGGSGSHGPNVTWTYIHISKQARFHNITFHTPLDEAHDRIYIIMYRNFMHGEQHDKDFVERFWYVAEQDRVVLESMEPVMTPEHNRYEFLLPADKCIARYREFCKVWEDQGWRIDVERLRAERSNTAHVIPSPRRRTEPKGWVLPTVPLRASSDTAATIKAAEG